MIWCQSGNPRSARLAVDAGWWYGFRSDGNHYADDLGPVALLDCHWVDPDWQQHLDIAAQVRPWLATVPDTMALEDLDRTIRQAEELAPYCTHLLIVPKAEGLIEQLPREIGGRAVVLGYSVPTSYGGTPLMLADFIGWSVHLLGGNPRRQRDLCDYLHPVSCDGNLAWRLARRGIVVTERGIAGQTLRQSDGERWAKEDAHLEALRRSLVNLRVFWGRRAVEWREERGESDDERG